MFKKVLSIAFCLTLCVAIFSGCGEKATPTPTASVPPGITKPEGRILTLDPPIIEGRVTKLTEKKIWVMIQGVEWELNLNDEAKDAIKKLAKNDIVIEKDTFVVVYYNNEENGSKTATGIERLRSN